MRMCVYMKKIGIITFHKSKSYGAVLQAYATLQVIKKMGYDAEFVDYTNYYEQNRKKILKKGINGLYSFLKCRVKEIMFRDKYWEEKAFGNILDIYDYSCSKIKSSNIQDFKKIKYDTIIVGSDQVWNPNITNGIDETYLLNFGVTLNRISYASSMGSYKLNESEKEIYIKNLQKFSFISVRELYSKNELQDLTDKNIKIVIDPTMLLTTNDWNTLINKFVSNSKEIQQKYILSFFVGGTTDTYQEYIDYVKKELGLPAWNIHINLHQRFGIDKTLAGVTVPEFINYIKNASFIITDSFHGTVFSLLFKKNFLPLNNVLNPVRVKELLNKFGISDRLNNLKKINNEINYKKVNDILEKNREDSFSWLRSAIENGKK